MRKVILVVLFTISSLVAYSFLRRAAFYEHLYPYFFLFASISILLWTLLLFYIPDKPNNKSKLQNIVEIGSYISASIICGISILMGQSVFIWFGVLFIALGFIGGQYADYRLKGIEP